jgi:adenylate cyclase
MNGLIRRVGKRLGLRRAIGFPLIVALLALRIWDPAPVENFRLRAFDFYQQIKPRVSSQRPVVIVDIDEASLAAIGQWPWPRTVLADMVTRLQNAGALAVAFDVLFPEADRSSPAEAIRYFRDLTAQTRDELSRLPSNDLVFADAIGRGRVVLGQSGINTRTPPPPQEVPVTGFAFRGPDPSRYLIPFPGLLHNVVPLEQAAAGRGLLTTRNENDGIVRRVPLIMMVAGQPTPALTLEVLRVVSRTEGILVRADEAGVLGINLRGMQIPTDGNARIWVNFGSHDSARFVPAKDVLAGTFPADRFANRLVLVGTSATGLLDIKTTPVESAMPGVEVHAQVLENILAGSALSAPSTMAAYEVLTAGVSATLLTLLVRVLSAGLLLLVAGGLIGGVVAASWILFSQYNTLFDASFPVLTVALVYIVMQLIGYFREQIDKRRIRSAFGQYLSPTLVEQLAQSPEKLKLGGEDRVVTVIFSDVRGFTSISESFKEDPQGLTNLMNRLLTPLSNAILERRGTIDKYMGDAIMGFWNAPLDVPQHEREACAAALDMLGRLDVLNAQRQSEASGGDTSPLKVGIGVNTGRVVVGNMGSEQRFQYTVMGDTVNLASRIEGQTKYYGVPILIGSVTAEALDETFAVIEVDSIRVKGKMTPETIYTLAGREQVSRSREFATVRENISVMLARYRARDWNGAEEALAAARTQATAYGLHGLFALYADRISAWRKMPPAPDWDGTYDAESK